MGSRFKRNRSAPSKNSRSPGGVSGDAEVEDDNAVGDGNIDRNEEGEEKGDREVSDQYRNDVMSPSVIHGDRNNKKYIKIYLKHIINYSSHVFIHAYVISIGCG